MQIVLEIGFVVLLALAVARLVRPPWRGRALNLLKGWVTVRIFWVLLAHPVTLEDGSQRVALRLIFDQLDRVDASTFWLFLGCATAIKFVGILASMKRWLVLLSGQGIEFPFRHIFGSFLIGRFIGTFLPSTLGLDGYKLYDASRFSGRTIEVTATTALEKVIGVTGIFVSFLIALPAGIAMFYSIFDRDVAVVVAGIGTAVCAGVIGAMLLVLWYPRLVQWFLLNLPIPGKARLEGLVMRVSHAAAAYRDKKLLVLQALALSFVVHFTTAVMYFFTALAIGAVGAEFWPIALASSIQILATVLSPFTIAGEGIRELAQLVLLQNMIGPAAAIVSAALGFWAAEALTLLGGFFWWARGRSYTPPYCLVDGRQVDYEEAARAALAIETPEAVGVRGRPKAELPPGRVRLGASAGFGLGTGVLGGLLIGLAEALMIARGGFVDEAQVLWYGPLAYAVLLGGLCLVGGALLAVLPMDRDEIRGWTPTLATLALIPVALAITLFRVRRDLYMEQLPPLPVLAAILGVAGLIALAVFLGGRRIFGGPLGALVRPLPALALLALAVLVGGLAARAVAARPPAGSPPPAVPAALSERPNVLLIMVDTLRADHLSCYGAADVRTPAMCSLAEDGGTRYTAFSHATWTKPSTATLLTSLLPTTHGAMSKLSALPGEAELVSEVLEASGYTTGAIVSNINLTSTFGFDQGFGEFRYLAPDYLAGAKESSSKLILYQIARKVGFKLKPGLRFGDFYQDSAVVNEVTFDWLTRHRNSRFFLFLHYMDPHDPYFEHPYDGHAIARVANSHPDPALGPEMRRLYVEEIEYLDDNIARLLGRLRDQGLYDDMLIVLTSDHGEEFYDHEGWWHGLTLYDEQIRVPLIVKWPSGPAAAPPRVDGHLVRQVDIAPTIIRAAGATPPAAMQGVDLTLDLDQRALEDRLVLAEEDHEGNVLRAVRTREWKLIEANEGNPRGLPPRELFDMMGDPGETQNHYEERRDLAAELRDRAEATARWAASGALETEESTALSRADCEKLRVLGYVEDCEGLN